MRQPSKYGTFYLSIETDIDSRLSIGGQTDDNKDIDINRADKPVIYSVCQVRPADD
ncbi:MULTISPECIES: hypothetical protein [Psychrobacter]|uniref:hypothetical protein n=1 Tax=Psychrobacter TaxID=497 RepID=UPI0015625726|nr:MULTISPECIES: hypothetical protein [Psychrobacter]MDE0490704.1 hypothetical protein [Psychrobacter sp. A3]MDN5733831.1 hypothetical protein [Psychrobacter sp.]